jgi:universal stress protein F
MAAIAQMETADEHQCDGARSGQDWRSQQGGFAMYSSILVPIALDHSGRSGPAIETARALLEPGGTITLLHVIEDIPSYASTYIPQSVFDQNREAAETKLDLMAKEVDAKAKTVVIWGHAASTILEFAREQEMDCIVIASHRPGIQDYFLGSTASRVVRHASCTVHVMR